MSNDFEKPVWRSSPHISEIDQGLRAHMVRVYFLMALGLGLTGTIAYLASTSPELMQTIHFNPVLRWVVALAPIGVVFYLSSQIHRLRFETAQLLFWVYSGLMGLSLSYIFILFTGQSIARIFFITSSVFAGMSLYGYTTHRDLTKMGSFLIMGVLGILLASVLNIFLQSSPLQMMVSFLAVLIFTGLTAYDSQKIKEAYFESDSTDLASKKAIIGALELYLDFINIFVALLRLFGDRR